MFEYLDDVAAVLVFLLFFVAINEVEVFPGIDEGRVQIKKKLEEVS